MDSTDFSWLEAFDVAPGERRSSGFRDYEPLALSDDQARIVPGVSQADGYLLETTRPGMHLSAATATSTLRSDQTQGEIRMQHPEIVHPGALCEPEPGAQVAARELQPPRRHSHSAASDASDRPSKSDQSADEPKSQPRLRDVCQVETCRADLRDSKYYYRRYKLCESCIKLQCLTVNGEAMRFCQQCSCLHPVQEFDGKKRSCRAQLNKHKARRRGRTSL
eukprot:scaffold243480_cov44-Prasinocladus_malaysianus.AAC.1